MFIKLCVILLITWSAVGQKESAEWDLAIAIGDTVEVLSSNGSLLGSTAQEFTQLKALTFDEIRHQFVVSDVNQTIDTIYSIQLTKETDITPIITNLPDDVQGLAIDPTTDILYWTDTAYHTINYVSLRDRFLESKVLFRFDKQEPQSLAIDICGRHIYWTNTQWGHPSIERAKLDGQEHEVIAQLDLHHPIGIAVDHSTQRIFWSDRREGIFYRIESAKFDGSERRVEYEGTYQKPFGVAVDSNAVYWTDISNKVVWKKYKNSHHAPLKLRHFKENPRGIITKHAVKNPSDCEAFTNAFQNYNGSSKEYLLVAPENESSAEVLECLNGGELVNYSCLCEIGFTGERCEIQLCHNYCVHGSCDLSPTGDPECTCPMGFEGNRCEREICNGFCLNDGKCTFNNTIDVHCECSEGFTGERCEKRLDADKLCTTFCDDKEPKILVGEMQLCHNYCVHGSCNLSSTGTPECTCPLGFKGSRCEWDMCNGFCLNDGKCSSNSTLGIHCVCSEGFTGERCEKSLDADKLCATFCESEEPKILVEQRNKLYCRCGDDRGDDHDFLDYNLFGTDSCSSNGVEKEGFIVVSILASFLMIACFVLAIFLYRACRRPRINKRVVVSKNVTPLTFRPQPTVQQCEITIEDCCNMNVCDTPCFDPPQLKGYQVKKKEEKKLLLENMGSPEDLY